MDMDKCSSSDTMGKSLSSSRDTPTWPLDIEAAKKYEGIYEMAKIIEAQCFKLRDGMSRQQFITFRPVTLSQLHEIDKERGLVGKDTRMTHEQGNNVLIVKLMPSALYEVAHAELLCDLRIKMHLMGTGKEVVAVQATRFEGRGRSKEADSALKPRSRPGQQGWPTLVFECGLSESLANLRDDARWWLEESGGEVNIVILISVLLGGKVFDIEEWGMNRQRTPRCPQAIEVDLNQGVVTGSSLVLEFQKIYLRPPVGQDTNFAFNDSELLDWAERVYE